VWCCCRDEFVGYSLCTLPTTPGCHHVSCPVWAAVEARRGFRQELTSELILPIGQPQPGPQPGESYKLLQNQCLVWLMREALMRCQPLPD
jgi:hypothetical protein